MPFANTTPVLNITWPHGATTGTARIVAGADTPPELVAYGILHAILFYITDFTTGLEIGYFFIGHSNVMDFGNQKDLLFGNVKYPTPGDPSSPGMVNVKTNHQIEMYDTLAGKGYTIFKDSIIQVNPTVPSVNLFCTNVFFQTSGQVQFNGPQNFFNRLTIFNPGSTTRWNNTATFQRENGSAVSVAGDPGKGLVNYSYNRTASANTVAGAPYSAEIVVSTITSQLFESGRAYCIEAIGGFNANAANVAANFLIRKGTTIAGALWWDFNWSPGHLGTVATGAIASAKGYLRRTAGTNLTSSFVMCLRTSNSGTGRHHGDAQHPRGIILSDCGDAADYPFAFDVV